MNRGQIAAPRKGFLTSWLFMATAMLCGSLCADMVRAVIAWLRG